MCSHREPAYADLPLRQPLPHSEQAQDRCVLLPLYPGMTADEQAARRGRRWRDACAASSACEGTGPAKPKRCRRSRATRIGGRRMIGSNAHVGGPRDDGGNAHVGGAPARTGRSSSRTAWIGGSSAANLLIGLVRTKAMAMLLGPAGFGLMGVFTAIADLARSVAEMGINSSGVRQIAERPVRATPSASPAPRPCCGAPRVLLGTLGALLLVLFAAPDLGAHLRRRWARDGDRTAVAGRLLPSRRRRDRARWCKGCGASPTWPRSTCWRRGVRHHRQHPARLLVCAKKASRSPWSRSPRRRRVASWWYSRKLQVARVTVTMSDARLRRRRC